MGTSTFFTISSSSDRDHPHAYGDKCSEQSAQRETLGSSPRVWGQEVYACMPHHKWGIIPTRMGTRYLCQRCLLCLWDHPHAYGDKSFNYVPTAHIQGSSPRVWGQVTSFVKSPLLNRIIPTRMGTSVSGFLSRVPVKDHPHAYGDKKLRYQVRVS